MGQLGKATVSARIGLELNQAKPRTHCCVQHLPLGGDLVEELGELLCQDSVLAGEHRNQGWEQPRAAQITVSVSMHVLRYGGRSGWASL